MKSCKVIRLERYYSGVLWDLWYVPTLHWDSNISSSHNLAVYLLCISSTYVSS